MFTIQFFQYPKWHIQSAFVNEGKSYLPEEVGTHFSQGKTSTGLKYKPNVNHSAWTNSSRYMVLMVEYQKDKKHKKSSWIPDVV